jgi:hypothetical protein
MAAHETLTVIRPDRHQRAQPHLRVAIRIPHANDHRIMVVFHAELDAALSAPGSLRCISHVEYVGHTAHESNSTRARVKVADLAFEVFHLGLPGLDGRWFQGLLKFLGSEPITDG